MRDDIDRLLRGEHASPHDLLGPHELVPGRWIVRVWRPDAVACTLIDDSGTSHPMRRVRDAGLFTVELLGAAAPVYRLEVTYPGGRYSLDDPYRLWPTLGDVDLHLIGEGRHRRLWQALGAHPRRHEGVVGTSFAVWAPGARSVRVVGDFNGWDGRLHPMRILGSSGVWEIFVPGASPGHHYKFEVLTRDGRLGLKADPMARATEVPPGTASVITGSSSGSGSAYEWGDAAWLDRRARADWLHERMAIYEVHLGSWRPGLGYRELAPVLADHVAALGFTHVELLPVAEHPFGGSWGYQVTGYYAPTARYGSPDDLRSFVDHLHQRGIGVIVDWVPAHFPRDDWALARFDGTALYEHRDPRQGEHPDWGTLVFNYGRTEVRNFLVANALYWLHEFHIDGLRVDAVASMLYLDYSRRVGEWVPNRYGGRENLDAIEFLQELNTVVHAEHQGVLMIAEESTAWPKVTQPVHDGGLGFTHKWNMGWMHDTLAYLHEDPVHRRWRHRDLTFGLLYAWSENYVLPLSHDEVVHGKGPLLDKMAGDRWQQFATLRALYAWMWAYPGRKLLFMGSELAVPQEWAHDRGLDWHLQGEGLHAGVAGLVRELNTVAAARPSLFERDHEAGGFAWLEADDADRSVYAFLRHARDGRAVVCVANFTPVPRPGYRVGLPHGGEWHAVLDTDQERFGGSGKFPNEPRPADAMGWHRQPWSTAVDLPPLGVLWLAEN